MGPDLPRWRVGRKLGRTLYLNDQCVGMVDTPEMAADIVAAMNAIPRCVRCGAPYDNTGACSRRLAGPCQGGMGEYQPYPTYRK
jgi:hypothetical protein